MSSIAENLERVEQAITAACRKAGRPRHEVRLMAVSKSHPVEALLEAVAAGHRLFGENRVQEFSSKVTALAESGLRAGLSGVEVHLIGHLQSNKSARAAELFDAIDTVDSLRIAQRLHAAAQTAGRVVPILLEIKLSHEEAKEGLVPGTPALAELLGQLPDFAEHMPLRGLMTVAPLSPNVEVARTCFRQLRELRGRLSSQHPSLQFDELSMGMSGDFEIAIEEGATLVRIGTSIFGARQASLTATGR